MDTFLFVALTFLVHSFLAAVVGSHAEVHGYNQWRWAPIVLVTGVVGVLLYLRQDGPPEPADPDEEMIVERPEPRTDRSHRKRLADPNTLHMDLPGGTTLTGSERAAVGALVEAAMERTDTPHAVDEEPTGDQPASAPDIDWSDIDTESLLADVFAEHDAGYSTLEVWWTDRMLPALEGLPSVSPPPDSEAYTLDLRVSERPSEGDHERFLVDDGDRSAEFVRSDQQIKFVASDTEERLTPDWTRLAKAAIESEATTVAESAGGWQFEREPERRDDRQQ